MPALNAIDQETKELTPIYEAKQGKKYLCPTCGQLEFPRMCTNRMSHYVLMPGLKHLDKSCKKRDRNVVVDDSKTEVESFHERLLRTIESGGGKEGGGEPRRRIEGDPFEIKRKPMQSLDDLAYIGYHASRDVPVGDGMLSDFLLNSKNINTVEKPFTALGPRAIYAQVEFANWDRKSIVFLLFGHNKRMVFELFFDDAEVYDRIRRKLFRKESNKVTGQNKYRRVYRQVLVHANWTCLDQTQCKKLCQRCSSEKDRWTCLGYQQGHYTSSRSISMLARDATTSAENVEL